MRKICSLWMVLTFFLLPVGAAEKEFLSANDKEKRVEVADTFLVRHLFNSTMFKHNSTDSLVRARHKRTFFHQVGNVFTRFFREFNTTDSSYIEDQHYNYTVMLQNTNTYEIYTLRNKEGQSITFAPDPSWRLGPYLGWRWVFLGYTFDLKHIIRIKRSLT